MISCIIVDDEPLSVSLLESYSAKCSDINLLGKFTNPFDALKFLETNKIDLIFLDVQMPELTGIQFMKIIQKKSFVILTTAYNEYALTAFDHDVVDYLLKPITYERFLTAVNKVKERITLPDKTATPEWFFVKSEYKMIKINYSAVLYLEGLRDYTAIHTDEKKILTLQSMKSFEEALPPQTFIRVHKSYLINLDKLTSVETNRVMLGQVEIPVGSSYEQGLKQRLRIS